VSPKVSAGTFHALASRSQHKITAYASPASHTDDMNTPVKHLACGVEWNESDVRGRGQVMQCSAVRCGDGGAGCVSR